MYLLATYCEPVIPLARRRGHDAKRFGFTTRPAYLLADFFTSSPKFPLGCYILGAATPAGAAPPCFRLIMFTNIRIEPGTRLGISRYQTRELYV